MSELQDLVKQWRAIAGGKLDMEESPDQEGYRWGYRRCADELEAAVAKQDSAQAVAVVSAIQYGGYADIAADDRMLLTAVFRGKPKCKIGDKLYTAPASGQKEECVWTVDAQEPLADTSCGRVMRAYRDDWPNYCSECGGKIRWENEG